MIGSEDIVSDEIGLDWILLCVVRCGREELRRGRNMSQKSKHVHKLSSDCVIFISISTYEVQPISTTILLFT